MYIYAYKNIFTEGYASMVGSFFKKFKKNSTQEEIKQLVDEDEEVGELKASQRIMINNIFLFDDTNAGDIMTHRTDIDAVDDTASLEDVAALSIQKGFSRIPVYHEDIDNIIGVVYVKDLLKFIGVSVGANENLKDYVREPLFVPETLTCGRLFKQMTETRIQLAIVVDEYGGTAGLVTMEDIVECIVGSIQDEYDEEEKLVEKIDDKTYLFDGSADIDDVSAVLKIEIPQGDYDTVAGFVINRLGYLPHDGEDEQPSIDFDGVKFTVTKVVDRRIEYIKAEID